MRILFIAPSPCLFTRNSKIHSDLLNHFSENNFVTSVVWDHDISYFLPTEMGKYFYKNIPIFPYTGEHGGIAPFVFETMKEVQPDIVVTIGDYWDTDFMWSIKSLYPHLFKWVAIIPSGSDYISLSYKMTLSYADIIITTSKIAKETFKKISNKIEYIPYGPDHSIFYPENIDKEFSVLNVSKNAQIYNVPAFLFSTVGFNAEIHINNDGSGDYDLDEILKKTGSKALFPQKYISIRDGISPSDLNNLYNSHDIIVDCSLQSSTGLTVLEAMSTGCLPVGMKHGMLNEIFDLIPKDFSYNVGFEKILGPKNEDFSIISTKEVSNILSNIQLKYSDLSYKKEAKETAINVAKIFSKDYFATSVNKLLETLVNTEHKIFVDMY